jgi:cell division cycle 14
VQITDKFIAFAGPKDRATASKFGLFDHEPSEFIDEFSHRGVTTVVRLNEASTYDKAGFTAHGIELFDIYFDDCSVPSVDVVKQFLDVCDSARGVVAVHCLAGLGRTVCTQ